MRRLASDHAENRTILSHDAHAAAGKGRWIEATDGIEIQEPSVVDVFHLEPDLVNMRLEHHTGTSAGIERRHRIAEIIGLDRGNIGHPLAPAGLCLPLVARGTCRLDKIAKEGKLFVIHVVGASSMWDCGPSAGQRAS